MNLVEAQILSMYLDGAAYDSWKNMSEEDRKDAGKVKDVLRATFGLRRIDAWRNVLSTRNFLEIVLMLPRNRSENW